MGIKELLQEQGKYYKNLTSNETIREHNKELVLYMNHMLLKQEYKAITELEKLLGEKPTVHKISQDTSDFRIVIKDTKIIYLNLTNHDLKEIPESINNLINLQGLWLDHNNITEIENLDKLTNLQTLDLRSNQITEIKNLDRLTNLQRLDLDNNKITEIKNFKNLTNLRKLYLYGNQIITNSKEVLNLRNKGINVRL